MDDCKLPKALWYQAYLQASGLALKGSSNSGVYQNHREACNSASYQARSYCPKLGLETEVMHFKHSR